MKKQQGKSVQSTKKSSYSVTTQFKSERRCFLISPIGLENSPIRKHADSVLEKIIEPALDRSGFQLSRIDRNVEKPGASIPASIVSSLRDSDLCIALLTDLNPNVMFEVGVRQAWDLPIINIADKKTSLPFDIQSRETLFYSISSKIAINKAIIDLRDRVMTIADILNSAETGTVPFVSEIFGNSMSILGRRYALDSVFEGKRDALKTVCDELRDVSQLISVDYEKNRDDTNPLQCFADRVKTISRCLVSKVYVFECLASNQHPTNGSRQRCEPLLVRFKQLQKEFNVLIKHLETASSSQPDFDKTTNLIDAIIQKAENIKTDCLQHHH